MEWIIGLAAFIAGGGIGGLTTWGLIRNRPPEVKIVETAKVVEKMIEVDHSLTNEDLLKIPCSAEYMDKQGDGLCREMFCRMNTRSGNNSNAAAAQECEQIANILNTKVIIETCTIESENIPQEELKSFSDTCIRLFEKRK